MKKLLSIVLCGAMLLFLMGCTPKVGTWNGETEVFAELLMVSDIEDGYRYAGMVDYVFVGTVTEVIRDVLPNTAKSYEDHYSTYGIHVEQNLKGELAREITASKMGGYKRDGTLCLVSAELPTGETIVDSGLPEVGREYVFLAYAQPDGSLILSELLDSRECTDGLIAEYADYIENEIPFDRERFVSQYEREE